MYSGQTYAQNCIQPTKNDYDYLTALSYAQLHKEQSELLNKYCFNLSGTEKFQTSPANMASSKEALINIEKKAKTNYIDKDMNEDKMDIFSYKLGTLETGKNGLDTLNYVKNTIKRNNPNINTSNIPIENINKSKKELLDYIATEYSKTISIHTNRNGDFALGYVIANNYPEYVTASLGRLQDTSLFTKPNKNNITPLIYMFSPQLKGKDTTVLSKKMINLVPVNSLIKSKILIYDYFQYAEAFKENNPYFYNELKNKYKFNITSSVTPTDYKTIYSLLNNNIKDED